LFVVLLASLLALFLIANRGAYAGYFSDDDLDNLSWTRGARLSDFASGLVSPRYYPHNFRPAGHLYFHLMGKGAGLDYRWYIAVIHLLHFINIALVWLLLRKLDLPALAAGAGTLVFAFHMGVFDALWKPMFVFDLLCALFCLLSLISYTARRWWLSLLLMWLAYKSKEQALMLPLVLLAWEGWLGERQWKRLIPFVAVSALFGSQALLMNPAAGPDYTLRLSLLTTVPFYASHLLLVPYAGLVVLLTPLVVRDRRLYFGLALLALLLLPMLFLPGRLFGAYLYAPLAGLAVVAAVIASRLHPAWIAGFFLVWLPFNYQHLRNQRRAALTIAQENHAYVTAVGEAVRGAPEATSFLYDGAPPGMRRWGINGALRWFTGRGETPLYSVEDQNLREAFQSPAVLLLSWDNAERKLYTASRAPGAPEVAYLAMSRTTPIWQLEDGWYPLERDYRWIRPRARARLWRPGNARRFTLSVNVGPAYIADVKQSRVEVLINDVPLEARLFTQSGWRMETWDLAPAPAGAVAVEFSVHPEYRPVKTDPRVLGIAIGGFGFAEGNP